MDTDCTIAKEMLLNNGQTKTFKLDLHKVINGEEFRSFYKMLIKLSNILICVISMSIKELDKVELKTIEKLTFVKEKIKHFYDIKQRKNGYENTLEGFGIHASVVIAVTKCDLKTQKKEKYQIWIKNVQNFGKKYNIPVVECSAKQNINI